MIYIFILTILNNSVYCPPKIAEGTNLSMEKIIKQNVFIKFLQTMRVQLLFACLLIICTLLAYLTVRNSFIQFSNTMGQNLSSSYATQVEINMKQHENLLRNYAKEIEKILSQPGQNNEKNINLCLTLFTKLNNKNLITPYIFYNNVIYGKDRLYSVSEFNFKNRYWYQKAVETDGKIICTPLYIDYTTQKPVITLAKKLKSLNGIIAIDIFPEFFEPLISGTLPFGGIYILADTDGNSIYNTQNTNKKDPYTQDFIFSVIDKIKTQKITEDSPAILTENNTNRLIYYTVTQYGWYSIIGVESKLLLADLTNVFTIIGSLFLLFLAFSFYSFIREYRLFADFDKITTSLNALSNRYISIYKINTSANTYEMLKFSEDAKKHYPIKGDYDYFLSKIHLFIEETAVEDFKKCFSKDNIKRLIDNHIYDYGGDFKRIYADGLKWVSIRCLIDPDSADEAILCILSIDQQKTMELKNNELLRNALEFAKQSQTAKNNFFSGISHDMRTPLNAIIGLAELAENYSSDIGEIKTYIKEIKISSSQLLNLVNDILNLSQIEQNKIAINAKQFNLTQCINDCVTVFQTRAKNENKTLNITCSFYNETVQSDDFRITQIINNLVSNAFKYTQAGNTISVEAKQLNLTNDNGLIQYQFAVKDNGIGMSEDFIKRIFVPYSRETRFSSSKIEGTGLGMSIVQSIVRQFDGTIDIQSKLHEGTAITVTLPLMPAENSIQTQENPKTLPIANLRGKRILIAEDNAINMQILSTILTKNGLEAIQAENGKIAFDIYCSKEDCYFDAVLMDMQMPVMDGCAAAAAIRSADKKDAASIPIIAVTANAFSEDLSYITKSGMNGCLLKPLDVNLLWNTLDKFINRPGTK